MTFLEFLKQINANNQSTKEDRLLAFHNALLLSFEIYKNTGCGYQCQVWDLYNNQNFSLCFNTSKDGYTLRYPDIEKSIDQHDWQNLLTSVEKGFTEIRLIRKHSNFCKIILKANPQLNLDKLKTIFEQLTDQNLLM